MMTDDGKSEVLKKEIINNSHLVVALPTFNADTSCPSVAFLMGTYPSLSTTTHHYQGNNSMGGGGGGDMSYQSNNGNTVDISNMLTNHDLQYQLWQKQQQQGQQQQQQQHDNTTQGGLHMMSVSDAFGSLPEVEDRPLPSLQMTSPPVAAVVEDVKSLPNVAMENDANVNGMIVDSEGERNSNTEDLNINKAIVNDNDDDFGDFDSSNHVPLQTTETMVEGGMGSEGKQNVPPATSSAAIVEDNDEDDFGGFESTLPQNDNNNKELFGI